MRLRFRLRLRIEKSQDLGIRIQHLGLIPIENDVNVPGMIDERKV